LQGFDRCQRIAGWARLWTTEYRAYYSRVRLPVSETVIPLTENPTDASVSRVGDKALGKPDDRLTHGKTSPVSQIPITGSLWASPTGNGWASLQTVNGNGERVKQIDSQGW